MPHSRKKKEPKWEDKKILMEVNINYADLSTIKKELQEWFEGHDVGMSGFKLKTKDVE